MYKVISLILTILHVKCGFFTSKGQPGRHGRLFKQRDAANPNLRQRFDVLNRDRIPLEDFVRRQARPRIRAFAPFQSSPIASVQIPPIQPVLDIITEGATSIYNQVQELLGIALEAVDKVITESFSTQVPLVRAVIATGNIQLQKGIGEAFAVAIGNITNDSKEITSAETTEASSNIANNNAALLTTIQKILDQLVGDLTPVVENGLSTSVTAIVDALTAANQDLYGQIKKLLEDPTNTSKILLQLVYADPDAIAGLLTNSGEGVYKAILELVNTAWDAIRKAINESAVTGVDLQTPTLNTANDALLESLNKNVYAMLDKVQAIITSVTTDEVTQIKQLIDTDSQNLVKDLAAIFSPLQADIEKVIKTVTEEQIAKTVDLITLNNNSVLDAVIAVLGPV